VFFVGAQHRRARLASLPRNELKPAPCDLQLPSSEPCVQRAWVLNNGATGATAFFPGRAFDWAISAVRTTLFWAVSQPNSGYFALLEAGIWPFCDFRISLNLLDSILRKMTEQT
jgi:hypothetical protein